MLVAPYGMRSTFDYGILRCLVGFLVGTLCHDVAARWRLPAVPLPTLAEAATVGLLGGWLVVSAGTAAVFAAPLVFSLLIFVFAAGRGAISRILTARPAQVLAEWSFAIYMVHAIVLTFGLAAAHAFAGPGGGRLFVTVVNPLVGHPGAHPADRRAASARRGRRVRGRRPLPRARARRRLRRPPDRRGARTRRLRPARTAVRAQAVHRGDRTLPVSVRAAIRPDGRSRGAPRVAGRRARALFAGLAVVATAGCLVALFGVSTLLLDKLGIPYTTSGGGVFAKVHPATVAALAACVFRCLAGGNPARTGWRLLTRDGRLVVTLAAVAVAGAFATLVSRQPVSPLVDTFVLPLLVFVLLRDLDAAVLRRLALLVLAMLLANAVIAMLEFTHGFHLVALDVPNGVTADPTRTDAVFDWRAEIANDWRATALLGHPLVNGLVVGVVIVCLAAPASAWLPDVVAVPLLLIEAASMFTFGARLSLVLAASLAGWYVLGRAVAAARGPGLARRRLALGVLVAGAAAVALAILAQAGFLDRTLERFTHDNGSASTRLTMFALFEPLSWDAILLGPDPEVVATWQRIQGLEFGIESSWIGLVLSYGGDRHGGPGGRARRLRPLGDRRLRAGRRRRGPVLPGLGQRDGQPVGQDDHHGDGGRAGPVVLAA